MRKLLAAFSYTAAVWTLFTALEWSFVWWIIFFALVTY